MSYRIDTTFNPRDDPYINSLYDRVEYEIIRSRQPNEEEDDSYDSFFPKAKRSNVSKSLEGVTFYSNPNETCGICLEILDDGVMTKCNHGFHAECLLKWKGVNPSCPMCRAERTFFGSRTRRK